MPSVNRTMVSVVQLAALCVLSALLTPRRASCWDRRRLACNRRQGATCDHCGRDACGPNASRLANHTYEYVRPTINQRYLAGRNLFADCARVHDGVRGTEAN